MHKYFRFNSSIEREMWSTKLSQIEKLTLGACASRKCCHMRQKMINGLAYKTNDWKERLPTLLKKLPNLKEIILLGGFCDDEVISLVGKYCDRLKLETIRICCDATEYTDPENLTDDGICEFIERVSGQYEIKDQNGLQNIQPAALAHIDLADCHYPNITAKSLSVLEIGFLLK